MELNVKEEWLMQRLFLMIEENQGNKVHVIIANEKVADPEMRVLDYCLGVGGQIKVAFTKDLDVNVQSHFDKLLMLR